MTFRFFLALMSASLPFTHSALPAMYGGDDDTSCKQGAFAPSAPPLPAPLQHLDDNARKDLLNNPTIQGFDDNGRPLYMTPRFTLITFPHQQHLLPPLLSNT
ncbi:hypothetical protein EIL50_02095 [bacterium NHP-B]|nr:hypothetical protein EIL50_02095 [bacterium NHP-B]